ncbi:MAG: hypothetical protein Q7J48_20550 [Nocardioides sp.]|nr:hypothetical protein [Nocardioides sp.]
MTDLERPKGFRRYSRAAELLRLYLQDDNNAADLMLELVPDEELRQLAESLVVMAGMAINEGTPDKAIELLTMFVDYARSNEDD